MNCPNPRFARYYDGFTGECKTLRFGCGKCASCLAAEQDSWSIRLQETASRSKDFIYTTLTFRPSAFRDVHMNLDVSDYLLHPNVLVSDACAALLDYWGEQIAPFHVPDFKKSVLSDWIKRGRENYFADTGERLQFKYMFVMEYGPLHSRPHAHGLLFGVKPAIFDKYFAKPWRDRFGFDDTKYIARGSKRGFQKSAACISKYISKYINKGVFESPLVKEGICSKPWRMVSNGIGEEYLNSPRFDFTRNLEWAITRELFAHSGELARPSRDLFANSTDLSFYVADSRSSILPPELCENNPFDGIELPYSIDQLKNLCIYVDESNYTHCLPRYYRDRLLGRTANLLRYLVQSALLSDAKQRRDTQVSALASSIEGSEACRDLAEAYGWSISSSALYMASLELDVAEHEKAVWVEARHFNNMMNHYKRPKSAGKGRVVYLQ